MYAYWTSKDLVSQKEELKCNNIINWYKTDEFWWCHKRKHKKHNPNWSEISDNPYKILIIGGSGSGKTNSLFNWINQVLIKFICMLKIHMKENISF